MLPSFFSAGVHNYIGWLLFHPWHTQSIHQQKQGRRGCHSFSTIQFARIPRGVGTSACVSLSLQGTYTIIPSKFQQQLATITSKTWRIAQNMDVFSVRHQLLEGSTISSLSCLHGLHAPIYWRTINTIIIGMCTFSHWKSISYYFSKLAIF